MRSLDSDKMAAELLMQYSDKLRANQQKDTWSSEMFSLVMFSHTYCMHYIKLVRFYDCLREKVPLV